MLEQTIAVELVLYDIFQMNLEMFCNVLVNLYVGLPSGFRIGAVPGRHDKAKKMTFYCQICLIELNSEDTMKSHVKG